MKIKIFNLFLLTPFFFFGQIGHDSKKTRESRFEIAYSTLAPFMVYASNIKESFHTTSFFKRTFPFIQPDEPDNYIYFRYVFKRDADKKTAYHIGLEYWHTKPDRFDKEAGDLNGLYLDDGYTQIGLGFGVYYDFSKDIIFNVTLSAGPMVSSPDWEGKEYIPYKVITPFLVNKYQITGWGVSNSIGVDVLITQKFALTGNFVLHFNQSRPLRATDGTSGSFHSLVHSFGIGVKYIFRRRSHQVN